MAWSWQARQDYADFLKTHGFNSYIYAPKSDRLLRQDWQQSFPGEHLENLKNLSGIYRDKGLEFGIGLSPFELYKNFDTEQQALLKGKLDQINTIGPSTLCILFDDMAGEFDGLASQQIKICNFILDHSQASYFIFCPTYYSYDPALTSHFGKMPDHYFEDIGGGLDQAIDIFWTGPKVLSESYPAEHLQEVAEKLRRLTLIWDNYPVNDAKHMTDFLHLQPFPDQAEVIKQYTRGHIANPMNQAYLSQIPLFSLANYYRDNPVSHAKDQLSQACQALCPAPLAALLMEDAEFFQQQGLQKLDAQSKQNSLARYQAYSDNPMAREVIDWLDGLYTFDPACLT